VGKSFQLDVLYSAPGRVYVREEDLVSIVENCRFRESTGRFFGILEFDIRTLIRKLSKFSVPGFVIRGKIENVNALMYASIQDVEIDILPVIYLEKNIRINTRTIILEIMSIIVSNDLLVLLEFIAK